MYVFKYIFKYVHALHSYCRGETVFSPEFKTPKGRLHGIAPTDTNTKFKIRANNHSPLLWRHEFARAAGDNYRNFGLFREFFHGRDEFFGLALIDDFHIFRFDATSQHHIFDRDRTGGIHRIRMRLMAGHRGNIVVHNDNQGI